MKQKGVEIIPPYKFSRIWMIKELKLKLFKKWESEILFAPFEALFGGELDK